MASEAAPFDEDRPADDGLRQRYADTLAVLRDAGLEALSRAVEAHLRQAGDQRNDKERNNASHGV